LVKKELANGVMYFRILICLKLNLVILCFFDLTLLYFIEFVACTIKKKKERKENSISNWSRKQDDVPIDIQPQ